VFVKFVRLPVGCVYFTTTTKSRQANDISDLGVRRKAGKGGDMKISPEW